MSNIHLVNYKPHIPSKTLFPTTKTVPRNKHNWVKFLVWFYNLNCILDLKKYHFSLIICKELKHVWYYVNPEFLWFLSVFLKSMTRSQAISLNNLRVPLIAWATHTIWRKDLQEVQPSTVDYVHTIQHVQWIMWIYQWSGNYKLSNEKVNNTNIWSNQTNSILQLYMSYVIMQRSLE